MAKAAVTKGTYVDLRFMPGLKVARVSIDIPIEQSNEFLSMFGAPDRVSPVWCAVARLATPAEPLTSSAPAPERSEPKGYTRSQVAFLKLKDPVFCMWLEALVGNGEPTDPDTLLKYHLGITSKAQMDIEGHHSQKRWDSLLTDFDTRAYAR